MTTETNHGGAREGAGRPRKTREAAPATRSMNAEEYLAAVIAGTAPPDPVRVRAATALIRYQRATQRAPVPNPPPRTLARQVPDLAATPAAQVEKRRIVEALRKLTEAGKASTARKMRAYLRAAYACAVKADSDAALPSAFIAFGVTTNPVESTAAIRARADKNPLCLADLRRYWNALQVEPGAIGAALRLHVLSGAQRVAQLTRVHERDLSAETMQLWDSKGRRHEPRAHLLPLTKAMRAELAKLSPKGYALSTDGGDTPMHPTSVSAWAAEVGKRAKIEHFQLKRVRSGVETALAAVGIPLHIRGQLQSHGISGVQATHYDAHAYLQEKRAALEALHRLLERKESKNVTPIGAKRRAA